MTNNVVGNYLRAHRRRCGLSQRDLGLLAGYRNEWQVSRHERSKTVPPLLVALAYEIVFQVPVAELFAGFQSAVNEAVVRNLEELMVDLESRIKERRRSKVIPQKLQWLTERRTH
jgi:DNA-binding XRE family transcriptional regulator